MQSDLLSHLADHYRALLGERLIGLVLYGSRARGTARPDSDVDLMLIAQGLPGDPFQRARDLPPPSLPLSDPPISLRALTPAEYERDIAPIDLDIAVDGKILHDRDGYMTSRLALIRLRIEEAGLVRDAGLAWRWRRRPSTRHWAVTWDGVRL
jgi:uncharacterized protein